LIQITKPEITRITYLELLDTVQNVGGVYFLYNESNELMYIGRADRLRSRLISHFRGEQNGFYHFIEYFLEDNVAYRDIYETYFINELRPFLNKQKKFNYSMDIGIYTKRSREKRVFFKGKLATDG
jgi:excinuclease UvrABC nuclease subunit